MKRILLTTLLAMALAVGCAPKGATPADYTAEQLNGWYEKINTGQAVASSYVDLQAKRLHYAVLTVEGKERLEQVIRDAGVPLEAVVIDLPPGALSEADPLKGCLLEQRPTDGGGTHRLGYRLNLGGVPLLPGKEFTIAVDGAGASSLTRGIVAHLECWDGNAWSPRYSLFSEGGSEQPAALVYSPNQVVIDIGFDAFRPGRFVLPNGLKPGWYRIRINVSGSENGMYQPYELSTFAEVQ